MVDGAQRRSLTGTSTASSTYPIPEAPEHRYQLGDLSIFQAKPLLTASDTEQAANKWNEFVGNKANSKSNRNEFARLHQGLTGFINPSGLDIQDIYPPMMHRSFNVLGSICLRIDHVANVTLGKKNKWMKKLAPIARKIDIERKSIKFDEIGYVAYFEKFESVVKEANFSGLLLEILTTCFANLKDIMPVLINVPLELNSIEYEIKMRCFLGCGVVFLFGRNLVTPAMKQLIAYTRFYIDKAKEDARQVGLDCDLGGFSDRVMEGVHKLWKQGSYCFSGGKAGQCGKKEYQEHVLGQQFVNEWLRLQKVDSKKQQLKRQLTYTDSTDNEKSKLVSMFRT